MILSDDDDDEDDLAEKDEDENEGGATYKMKFNIDEIGIELKGLKLGLNGGDQPDKDVMEQAEAYRGGDDKKYMAGKYLSMIGKMMGNKNTLNSQGFKHHSTGNTRLF